MTVNTSTVKKGFPPGPTYSPFLQLCKWVLSPCEFMDQCHQRYGESFTANFFGRGKLAFFSHPQALRDIFTAGPQDAFAGQANGTVLLDFLGENSLLTLDGERHLRERRLMLPPFHGERMRLYGRIIHDTTQRIVAKWPTDKIFSAHPWMQTISLEIILSAVFGISEGELFEKGKRLLTSLMSFSGRYTSFGLFLPFLRRDFGPLSPWRRFMNTSNQVDEFIYQEIRRRREENDLGGDDILTMLLQARDEDGQPMSEKELRDELITLLLAGHETTATSLASAIYWIHHAPGVLDKLLEELPSRPEDLDLEAVTRSKYLDGVCKETLRISPVVVIVARVLQKPLQIMDYQLDAGMPVAPAIYLTHYREDLYPEPHTFRAERFIERQYTPYEFLPFGGGVRRCIGAAFALYEMKIVLASLLTKCRIELAEKRPMRLVRRGVTMAPASGVRIRCKQRV